ncbi:MAG: signal peptide peptidase SppA [Pirellulales bacterium]|nr:signal peptide peptidase SppA [Pirellulales bacterium]
METSSTPEPVSPPPAATPTHTATVLPVVQKIILEQSRRGWFWWWLLIIALAVSLFYNFELRQRYERYFSTADAPKEKYHSLSKTAEDKVAIIRIEGTILDQDSFAKDQIDEVRRDTDVKAVVLRVDSPGGTVTASDYLYHHLVELLAKRDIPLVVSMGGLAASGGYYVAMACGDRPDVVYAEPTTWCGSIGVVIPHYNVAGLMEEWKIQEDSIKSHPLKTLGSFTKAMSEEERTILQKLVDEGFRRFKEVVAAGRPKLRADAALLDKVATGQVFATTEAIDLGLVDKQGFLEDAINRAIELASLDRNEVRVVEYEQDEELIDALLSSASAPQRRSEWERLAELAVPRAYYLWTQLPGVSFDALKP